MHFYVCSLLTWCLQCFFLFWPCAKLAQPFRFLEGQKRPICSQCFFRHLSIGIVNNYCDILHGWVSHSRSFRHKKWFGYFVCYSTVAVKNNRLTTKSSSQIWTLKIKAKYKCKSLKILNWEFSRFFNGFFKRPIMCQYETFMRIFEHCDGGGYALYFALDAMNFWFWHVMSFIMHFFVKSNQWFLD